MSPEELERTARDLAMIAILLEDTHADAALYLRRATASIRGVPCWCGQGSELDGTACMTCDSILMTADDEPCRLCRHCMSGYEMLDCQWTPRR